MIVSMDQNLDESRFHVIADAVLQRLSEQLEPFYDSGALEELDLQDGILTILAASGRTYLITKHSSSRQIWLASPVSGGLHFIYNGTDWRLTNQTELKEQLQRELAAEEIVVAL